MYGIVFLSIFLGFTFFVIHSHLAFDGSEFFYYLCMDIYMEVKMELRLKRIACNSEYTIGKLYLGERWICDILEPPVRDLDKSGEIDGTEVKIQGNSAIPYGRYRIDMTTKSPKYSNFLRYPWARDYNGCLPRFMDVPSFEGVLIHVGNTVKDTEACLLTGYNTQKGYVTSSTRTFLTLMDDYLLPAHRRGEEIYITIE